MRQLWIYVTLLLVWVFFSDYFTPASIDWSAAAWLWFRQQLNQISLYTLSISNVWVWQSKDCKESISGTPSDEEEWWEQARKTERISSYMLYNSWLSVVCTVISMGVSREKYLKGQRGGRLSYWINGVSKSIATSSGTNKNMCMSYVWIHAWYHAVATVYNINHLSNASYTS